MNHIQVAEGNPVVFFIEIQKAIQNGFYVTNDIAGYPIIGMPMIINMFETDQPEIKNEIGADIHTAVLEGWNILTFLMDFQNLVMQGFEVDDTKVLYGDYKSFVMKRPEPVTLDLNPTPKAETEEAKPTPARKPRTKKGE